MWIAVVDSGSKCFSLYLSALVSYKINGVTTNIKTSG
jgi:hypothetical protein